MSITNDFGIARYAFPSGKMLDHVSTEIVPVGPPCWFPGTQARIVFGAGDGNLYQYAFEPESWVAASEAQAGRDLHPWPVVWRCSRPGLGKPFLSDLSWPEDPRMSGSLIVALRELIKGPGHHESYSKTSLCWLKLNFAGNEIVELGRLLFNDENEGAEPHFDHRNPTVGTLPDGRLALAYLRQRSKDIGWEVRIAPIVLDNERHIPQAFEAKSLLLAEHCQPAHLTFSSDGRWLNAMTGAEPTQSRVLLLPLAGRFGPAR